MRTRGIPLRRQCGLVLCLATGFAVLAVAQACAGQAEVPDMPQPAQDTMQAMQNVFGGLTGGGGGGGAEAQASIKTIKRLLAKERNIKIWESRGRIFLEGRVTSRSMKTRIQKLLEIYGNLVDLTEYRPEMDTFLADMELIKQTIETTLNRNYLQDNAFVAKQTVSVNIVNDKIVLSGELNTPEDIKKALHIARIYNDSVVDNLNVRKQMIEVAAIFAKMKETDTDRTGTKGAQSAIVTLPTLVGAARDGTPEANPIDYFSDYGWTGGPVTATLGGNDFSMTFFNALDKSAVLARPHLAAVNGQTSRFMGGGEKAIKTVTANASDINYKEYGVILSTTPSLTTDGRIRLAIELEFSVPEANGEDFITFRHEGEAILSSGQGMVLSGLIQESRSHDLTQTPFVGKVPILKFFFSQRGETKEGEDLTLITIPRVPGRVSKANWPRSEDTAKTAERAGWIHKPRNRARILGARDDRAEGWWTEEQEIVIEHAPADYQEQTRDEGTITLPEELESGYRPGAYPDEEADDPNVGNPEVTAPAREGMVDEAPRGDVPEVAEPDVEAPEGHTDEAEVEVDRMDAEEMTP